MKFDRLGTMKTIERAKTQEILGCKVDDLLISLVVRQTSELV
jgi:hypothetical protein